MQEIIIQDGKKVVKFFRADKPAYTRPEVRRNSVIRDGKRVYIGKGKDTGKVYVKELFDKMFKVG